MRRDIAFEAEGTTLRGWLYLPDSARLPVPTVVLAHGFSGVKEQLLDRYAAVFAAAGLGSLVFDHRCFGASEGEPRQEIDPIAQLRDYRHAISFAQTLPEVDRESIGIWGTSYSGGTVLMVGALDRRVRCVVAQVPHISGHRAGTRPDLDPALLARFDADREARFRGEPAALLPVVSAPSWRNEVTLRSLELLREWEPLAYVGRISPTPLLMIVASHDRLTPTDLALEAYERALQPKRLVLVPGGHFVAYGDQFATASTAARDWFVEHLSAGKQQAHSPDTP